MNLEENSKLLYIIKSKYYKKCFPCKVYALFVVAVGLNIKLILCISQMINHKKDFYKT